jgi:aurora kinase
MVMKLREQLLFLNLSSFLLGYRIVKVDLKFPLKPFVSPAAKDLISQVRSLQFFPCLVKKMVIQMQIVISQNLINCCTQMLVKNSAQRLPLHKVLEHPWIVQNADPSGVYRG